MIDEVLSVKIVKWFSRHNIHACFQKSIFSPSCIMKNLVEPFPFGGLLIFIADF